MAKFYKTFRNVFKFNKLQKKRGKRVKANDLYKQVISDRNHIHMNATIWSTLTNFVIHLGKSGKCEVDQAGKDWYVRFIVPQKDDHKRRQIRLEAGDEEMDRKLVSQQKKAYDEMEILPSKKPLKNTEKDDEKRLNFKEKLAFSLKPTKNTKIRESGFGQKFSQKDKKLKFSQKIAKKDKDKRNKKEIEKLMLEDEKEKQRRRKKDEAWLREGLIVKINDEQFCDGRFFGKKAIVQKVHQAGAEGEVEMLGTKELIKIGCNRLKVVLPRY